ncbi:transposon-encoded TnpW family protein [Lachnospiraceae bacterium 54-11]
MTDTPNRSTATTARRPDCVTEVRRGNTVLVVSGYFKQDTTAADKMMKVLEAESAAGGTAAHAI